MEVLKKLDNVVNSRQSRLLKVVLYPDPVLFKKSDLVVASIPDDLPLQNLLDDMVCTLETYRAIGLSAVQVGIWVRAFVVRDGGKTLKIINPVIKEVDGRQYENEGCLSMPGAVTRVARPAEVVLHYFDELGEAKTSSFTGLLARAVAHECDHLNGELFLSKMNFVQRESAVKKYKKLARAYGLNG